ncbi:hypothetical protein [Lysinibacillus sp. LZ02]|uniref:hypothetical protein n=1 Tax=Lysinibacillus sp. LZ02 TaxID=3420668 RepID=UPI003D36B8B3
MDWLIENKEWVFSGVGLFIISTIITLFTKTKNKKQVQKVGNNSTAIQVGRDFKVGETDDKK